MAVVTQAVTPDRFYTPFEGMPDAVRLRNGVPRGLFRFFSDQSLAAKPVNDTMVINFTMALPPNFAYTLSKITYMLGVDTASDWEDECIIRAFNTMPNVAPGNEQWTTWGMRLHEPGSTLQNRRVLTYELGTPREFYPTPMWLSEGGVGHSFLLNYANKAAAVQAAGVQFLSLECYQYDLSQAVRYPLNSPLPTTLR